MRAIFSKKIKKHQIYIFFGSFCRG